MLTVVTAYYIFPFVKICNFKRNPFQFVIRKINTTHANYEQALIITNLYKMEILLHEMDDGSTKSTIKLKQIGNDYLVDGYDRGRSVKQMFGGFGYEYSMKFNEKELNKLDISVVENESIKEAFLKIWIKKYINDPMCFSKIKAHFDEKGVEYKYFNWRDAD